MTDNNISSNKTICDSYQGSIVLGIESGILLLLALGSQAFNYILLPVLLRSGGHLPLTTKLLLINCTVAGIIKSAYFVVRSVYNFCLLQYGFINMAIERRICETVEIPYAVSTLALLLSMIFIGFERLWSTWKKNLPQAENIGCVRVWIQVLIWVSSVSLYALMIIIDPEPGTKKTCYCYYPMLLSPDGTTIHQTFIIGTQSLNMVIYFIVFWCNKKQLFEFTLNAARHNLTERFVMWSNVKATKMLIPASISHAFTYDFVILFSFSARKIFPDITPDASLCVTGFTFCILCLDTMLHPILCLRYNESLRDIAIQRYPKISLFIGKPKGVLEKSFDNKTDDRNCEMKVVDNKLPPTDRKSKQYQMSTGTKTIIEYRVKPEHHQDILNDMWNDAGKKNYKKNTIKPI